MSEEPETWQIDSEDWSVGLLLEVANTKNFLKLPCAQPPSKIPDETEFYKAIHIACMVRINFQVS